MKIIVLQKGEDDEQFSFVPYSVEQYLNILQSGDYYMANNGKNRPYTEWIRRADHFTIRYYGIIGD